MRACVMDVNTAPKMAAMRAKTSTHPETCLMTVWDLAIRWTSTPLIAIPPIV